MIDVKKIVFVCWLSMSIHLHGATIKHIFVDINTLIATSQSIASKHVGIIASMRYLASVGHIPSKVDLFKALQDVPAQTDQFTHNDNLLMPLIFSDWLMGLQSNSSIKANIYHYLEKSHLTEVEKTIFKNISNMMLSPTIFIDTQYLIKEMVKILNHLKKAGYTVYIIGNWDKESEPYLMKLLHHHLTIDAKHCYFSNKAKQLKPQAAYFDELIHHFHLQKKDCLIIDVEKNHVQSARNLGFTTILLHGQNHQQLKSELTRIGIRL